SRQGHYVCVRRHFGGRYIDRIREPVATEQEKSPLSFLRHYCLIYAAVFYRSMEWQCERHVLDLCRAWLWYGFLGHFCNDGSRAVWNQPARYGGNHYPEYGKRYAGDFYTSTFPVAARHGRGGICERRDLRRCDHHGYL